jgi:hypothetical protein
MCKEGRKERNIYGRKECVRKEGRKEYIRKYGIYTEGRKINGRKEYIRRNICEGINTKEYNEGRNN